MNQTDPFATGHFYHLYNKSMDNLVPFSSEMYSGRFLQLIWYYRSTKGKVSYSGYEKAEDELKNRFEKNIDNPAFFQVEILAFCLMDNHYHLLLRQNTKDGIMQFMNNVTNAFTRHYNLLQERKGPIFIPQYKSRLIHTEEQLIHVSRYIHLNPYSAGIIKSFDQLFAYPLSSLREYIFGPKLANTSFILNTGYFVGDREKYKRFVMNNADYQKKLEYIKHVEKWN